MSSSQPRVFVTQESDQLNYSHAEHFGEIHFLTRRELSPVPSSLVNAEVMAELAAKLANFDLDHDYLAPSGSPAVCGLAFFVLGSIIGHDRAEQSENGGGSTRQKCLRILRWSNRDRVYQPITIHL
jgi:hypothetical protein